MTSTVPFKKLVITAFYTSVLIGTLAGTSAAFIHEIPVINLLKGIIPHTLFILLIWALNIVLVYLAEKLGRPNSPMYTRYILSFLICALLIVLSRVLLSSHGGGEEMHFRLNPEIILSKEILYASFVLTFVLNSIVLIIQDLILLRQKKFIIELENAELIIRNTEAKNQQLKQQIHPHFLFNSLNTLKTLIKKNPDKAEDYLVMLSGFLRASISSDSPNSVRLKDEINLCLDYLEMQKMRFDEALQYVVKIPEEIQKSGFVPVFSILPLLENAIKHNILTVELPLQIKMEYENGRIVTTNNIQPKKSSELNTGLGMENLAERYKIISGDEIIVNENANEFSVSIKILDNENSNYRR